MADQPSWKHPEQREGEVFLTNSDWKTYHQIGWNTKRAGYQAYDIYNKPLFGERLYPVFVKRSELEKAGINPDNLGH